MQSLSRRIYQNFILAHTPRQPAAHVMRVCIAGYSSSRPSRLPSTRVKGGRRHLCSSPAPDPKTKHSSAEREALDDDVEKSGSERDGSPSSPGADLLIHLAIMRASTGLAKR